MYCGRCEEYLPETANFCLRCGRATSKNDSPPPPEGSMQPAPGGPTRAVAASAITVLQMPQVQSVAQTKGLATTSPARPVAVVAAPVQSEARIRQLLDDADAKRTRGHLREALALCAQALGLDGEQSEIYLKLGEIFEACHRFEEALTAYAQAIRIGTMPTSEFNVKAEALERTGRILYEQHRYTHALRAVNQSFKLDPRRPSLLKLRHDVLVRLNRFYEARQALRDYEKLTLPQCLRDL